MNTKITCASKKEVKELEPYVEVVMEALGHPEALVTDESSVWDFLCFFDETEKEKELEHAEKILGRPLYEETLIIDVARDLMKNTEVI